MNLENFGIHGLTRLVKKELKPRVCPRWGDCERSPSIKMGHLQRLCLESRGEFRNASHTLLQTARKSASNSALERIRGVCVCTCARTHRKTFKPQAVHGTVYSKTPTLLGWSEYPKWRVELESSQETVMPPAPGRSQSGSSGEEAEFIPDLKVIPTCKMSRKMIRLNLNAERGWGETEKEKEEEGKEGGRKEKKKRTEETKHTVE